MVERSCCGQRYQVRRGPRLLLLGEHTKLTTATSASRKSSGDIARGMGISFLTSWKHRANVVELAYKTLTLVDE
jgi:hypothetical protein